MLNEQAKKSMLRKIPHGLYVCGAKDGDDLNGFTASWVMQSSFTPPMVVTCIKADSTSHAMVKVSGCLFPERIRRRSKRDRRKISSNPCDEPAISLKTSSFIRAKKLAAPLSKTR